MWNFFWVLYEVVHDDGDALKIWGPSYHIYHGDVFQDLMEPAGEDHRQRRNHVSSG